MGHSIYITRKPSKTLPQPEINSEEWAALIAVDPELTPDSDNPLHAHWSGLRSIEWPAFEWIGDHCSIIFARNPSSAQLRKAFHIAQKLQAKVYDPRGQLFEEALLPESKTFCEFDRAKLRQLRAGPQDWFDFLYDYSPRICAKLGVVVVVLLAALGIWGYASVLVSVLAISVFVLDRFYARQRQLADAFTDWLHYHFDEVSASGAWYEGRYITLDTHLSQFQGAYGFILGTTRQSRWYIESEQAWGRLLHNAITLLFGLWELPPLAAFTILASFSCNKPGWAATTVRRLYSCLDGRFARPLGLPEDDTDFLQRMEQLPESYGGEIASVALRT